MRERPKTSMPWRVLLSDPHVLPRPRTRSSLDSGTPFLDMREQADAGDALAALEYSWALAQGEHGLDHDAVMSMQYARRAVELAKSSGEDHIAGEALFTVANLRGDEEVREEVWRELPGADSRRCQLQDGDKHVLDALKRAAALGHARARLALAETLQGSGGDDASRQVHSADPHVAAVPDEHDARA